MTKWQATFIATYISILSPQISADILDQRFSPALHNPAVSSWKKLRSTDVILQKLDYSCDAASLATLLSSYYGLNVSEKDIIDVANKDEWFSFADIQSIYMIERPVVRFKYADDKIKHIVANIAIPSRRSIPFNFVSHSNGDQAI